jgi:transposase
VLYFGIDWSQDHHDLCILNEAGARMSQIQFEHSPTGFAQIELERRKLDVPAPDCLVGIETSYNLVVDFLLDYEYPVYVIPPQATDGYRNRQRTSGAHDDRSDAALLASIMHTDRASHRRLRPNQPLTLQMAAQVRLIELLRRSIQRQANQLQAVLLRTYPQAVGWFSDLTTQILLEFLTAYPTATAAHSLTLDAFQTFMRNHGYKRSDLIGQRYAALHESVPAAPAPIIQAYQSQVQSLAQVRLSVGTCFASGLQ